MSSSETQSSMPYRQIRAHYDSETITVYQAYSVTIATAAVEAQKLNASPDFKPNRMTWIKPSWAWMMYRSNYSLKDPQQSHILALKIPHSHFHHILSSASVTPGHDGTTMTAEEKAKPVRVQWDPERSIDMKILPYRSIQIGISGDLATKWVDWIESIEDVTQMARRLKEAVDAGLEGVGEEEMVERGLLPRERVYAVDEELRKTLKMDLE
ncbi:MAG: hypothetical protein LQ350_003138 [Teloschistes chrysophthalmus]|nr:MAG: hypothetical protein LQ350_003138 [Niorma chrysophthalma]